MMDFGHGTMANMVPSDIKCVKEVTKMGRDKDNYKKWVKDSILRYNLNLNRINDKEIIDKLESVPNKRQYIISLIKQDIEKGTNN